MTPVLPIFVFLRVNGMTLFFFYIYFFVLIYIFLVHNPRDIVICRFPFLEKFDDVESSLDRNSDQQKLEQEKQFRGKKKIAIDYPIDVSMKEN